MDISEAIEAIDYAFEIARHPASEIRGLGFCCVRISELDQINHRTGFETSQLLVDEIRDRLENTVRPGDEIFQVREDEFGVLFHELRNEEHARLAAMKIEREIAGPITLIDERILPNAHIGIAFTDDFLISGVELFERAFAGLKQAVVTDTSHVVGDDELRASMAKDAMLMSDIRDAFEAGEFFLHFQPKTRGVFGGVVGAEALTRWHSPSRGLMRPDDFIPAIEESDLVDEFTWFVIKSAITACAHWPGELGVAVNVPPIALQNDLLPTLIADTLAINGLESSRFTVEVTERGMFKDQDSAFAMLKALRESGVRVSIDDFGTGQSSLVQFRDLPADEIKIDRTFVAGLASDPNGRDALIVKAIVDLAHTLGLTVVSEGVESQETADALTTIGCDVLQGFGLGKPMPHDEFEAWCSKRFVPMSAKFDDETASFRIDT